MEKWISLNQYMKKFNIGHDATLNLIANKEIEARKTAGGQYRIKIGGDTVSKELFEEERKKRIEAETTIKLLKNILITN